MNLLCTKISAFLDDTGSTKTPQGSPTAIHEQRIIRPLDIDINPCDPVINIIL